MSQFFKALEQAERDRMQEEEAEKASAATVARTMPQETAPPVPEPAAPPKRVASQPDAKRVAPQPDAKRLVPQPDAKPVVPQPDAKPVVPQPHAVKPVIESEVAKPAAEVKPVVPPAEPKAVPAAPKRPRPIAATITERTSPVTVFRPSLSTPPRQGLLGRVNGRPPVLVAQNDPTGVAAEAYRTLRANMELMSDNGECRHVSITSPGGGDGKSTTAANLAVVAAQGGRRVCLVDADLRRPTVHEIFGLPNVDGLTTALEHGKPLHTVAKPADIPNLSVVVSGRSADEPFRDVLTPQRLESVLQGSEAAYDLVIFDGPPVISGDALSVAAVCGGVILVVRAGSIPFSVLRRAIGQISQVKGRVIGVLLNRADLRADGGSYGYYRATGRQRPGS